LSYEIKKNVLSVYGPSVPSMKVGFDAVPERAGSGAQLQQGFTRGMRVEAVHE